LKTSKRIGYVFREKEVVDKEVMRTYPKPKKVCHKKNKMQEREK
jgi:hypothetical protein